MKKIKDVVDEAVAFPLLERRLQLRKIGNAIFIFDDNLAVDQRRACGEFGNRGRDVREFFGPVETFASEQTRLAAVEPGLNAVSVYLELVCPAAAARHGRMQGGERRQYESRERRVAWPPVLVLVLAGAAPAAFLCSSPIASGARALLRALLRTPRRREGMAFRRAGLDVLLHASVRMPDP